eukprot:jgi/Bigna1/134776/aug1.26_g9484
MATSLEAPRRRQKKPSIIAELPRYYRDEMAVKFKPVLHFLQDVQRMVDLRREKLDRMSLSILIGELQMFHEKTFGLNGNSRECTKLPPHVFQDFSIGGGVCLICLTCYEKKIEYGWDKFYWDHIAAKTKGSGKGFSDIERKNIDICLAIYKMLVDRQVLEVPSIFFEKGHPSWPTLGLEKIITAHGGVISQRRDDATHIVILNDPNKRYVNPDQDYLRTIEIKGNRARVHWWYFPDSYDQWLSQSEIEGQPEPPMEPQGAWRVTERFITDLKKYNEWMNELDYSEDDVEEEEDDKSTNKAKKNKKKRKSSSSKKSTAMRETKARADETVHSSKKLQIGTLSSTSVNMELEEGGGEAQEDSSDGTEDDDDMPIFNRKRKLDNAASNNL